MLSYVRWLHTGWPAGTVEKLPEAGEGGVTAVSGVRIVGDLTGIPLLKFSADTGARAVQAILAEDDFKKRRGEKGSAGQSGDVLDLAIIGAGVSGMAAAMEAKKAGLRFAVYEAAQPFSTVVNFPKAKPIYTYPTDMKPAGEMQFTADVKEALLDEMEAQRKSAGVEPEKRHVDRIEKRGGELVVHFGGKEKGSVSALRVIIAIGRSGNYRALGCPGEKLDKVFQRLYDPKDHAGKKCLVVGGGDSALETAIALALAGAQVTLSYRNKDFARPKPENVDKLRRLEKDPGADVQIERPSSERVNSAASSNMQHRHGGHIGKGEGGDGGGSGSVRLMMASKVKEITDGAAVVANAEGKEERLENDVVFAMIGREAPLDFFRRSGIPIRGEWRPSTYLTFALFFAFCCFIYTWKAGTSVKDYFEAHGLFPFNIPKNLGEGAFATTFAISVRQPGFYYSLAYTVCIAIFGYKRIKKKQTPYVTWQTLSLAATQTLPLFLLPYFILPIAGYLGAFDSGFAKTVADNLFPTCNYDYGREYWRAFGLILAWPLFFWNVFSGQPMKWWLAISFIQTFVLIPLLVRRWGKGAYCGWICSCGALAETLGDAHRQKMPHGPIWNRLNMVGQVILGICFLLFIGRVVGWYRPDSAVAHLYEQMFYSHSYYDYYHVVDIFLAGIVGVGMYFWFSGRVWCRFACPLAALMHIYARFTTFRIFADKKKCISCNVCTSVCHQGIDIMSFANKGMPMEDPECVRCSACVQSCPTGVLTFGRYGKGEKIIYDSLPASPVQMKEGKVHLAVVSSSRGALH